MPLKNCFSPIAIDLFCGAGGLSKGLTNAGVEVCLGVEINPIAAKTYSHNLSENIIIDDIHKVSYQNVLEKLSIRKGDLFLLAGCPPCQTFSSLQKGEVCDDVRDELIFEYVRFALELEPYFILMENVPGMSRGRGKDIFKKALALLQTKYIITYGILNCADYGVPQTRKRLVVHGIRKDIFNLLEQSDSDFQVQLPQATHSENSDTHPGCQAWINASVIMDLPPVMAGEVCCNESKPYNHETNGMSETNKKRIRYIREHGGSRTCLPPELQLPCHQKSKVGYTGVYGILDLSSPAPTITSGCICFSKGRYGHPTQDRAITVREAARLQSFDDEFIFCGSRSDTALQVGNAVPPLLAEASGRYFLSLYKKLKDLDSM